MKKLLFFSQSPKNTYNDFKNVITGGQLYNYKLATYIERYFPRDVEFKGENGYHISGNIAKKVIGYIKNAKSISEYEYIIIDSTALRIGLILKEIHKYNPQCKITVIHHHFIYLDQPYISPKRYLLKIIQRCMLEEADFLIIPNQYPYDMAVNKMKIDRNKIYHIENAFDKKRYKELTKYKQGFLLYVGTIEHRKGIHILIRALAKIKEMDYHMHFVGKYRNDLYFKRLKKAVSKYGLEDRITFYGRVSDDELRKMYTEASVFVFPSLNEGYGLAILEAMAHGLPVVAFDNTAMPLTVINQVNGFLVKNKDSEMLAAKIKELINDKKLVRKMGKNAVSTFEKAKSDEDMENSVMKFVNDVLV